VEKYSTIKQVTGENIQHKRVGYWITKTTDTNSECVILIAFPRQEWIRERTSMFHYMYGTLSVSYVPSVGHFGAVLSALLCLDTNI
jgi:hypothetical protein